MSRRLRVLLPLLALMSAPTLPVFAKAPDRPGLVLFLVIDQLRGDTLPAHARQLSPEGLGGLLSRGVYYANAYYQHATTYTSVGHATLVTGAGPRGHGIVGNDWYSTKNARRVYSCDDPSHHILGEDVAAPFGSSPRNLIGSTIGDELVHASGGSSRVFSVSGKDRGAILTAGRLGDAYWYSKGSGRFVTSSYYHDAYPAWVNRHNDDHNATAYAGRAWTLQDHPTSYRFHDQDDRPYERPPAGLTNTFPHTLPSDPGPTLLSTMRATPYLDELTVDFARALLTAEHVGQGASPDMLVVSLSATDYIGHAFGPDSLEAEDNLRQLDRSVAKLLAAVDEQVGLDRTWIVLSSDHGVDLIPEHHHALHGDSKHRRDDQPIRTVENDGQADANGLRGTAPETSALDGCHAGRHRPDRMLEVVNTALRDHFGIDRDLAIEFWNPSIYLDEDAIRQLLLDITDVEEFAADVLREIPGIARVFPRNSLSQGQGPRDPIAQMVRRSFHPDRSGHLLVIQEPAWYLHPEWSKYAAMHGSPYAYDTHVPILVASPNTSPKTIYRRVGPEDIASTLAMIFEVPIPSGSDGDPLHEILGQ